MDIDKLEEGLRNLYDGLLETDEFLDDVLYMGGYIHDETTIGQMIRKLKMKNKGSIKKKFADYFNENDLRNDHDTTRYIDLQGEISQDMGYQGDVWINKKNGVLGLFMSERYTTMVVFLVPAWYKDKFISTITPIFKRDNKNNNIFGNLSFSSKKGEYHEVSDLTAQELKDTEIPILTVKKNEKLFFSESSILSQIRSDINKFFTTETEKTYKSLGIDYKRGAILYGPPGNGKSALIREIIRELDNVIKVVINPNVSSLTNMLTGLFSALRGNKALIIIEDIDSLVSSYNRSDLLNLLDGVNEREGMYLIGTTNYPGQLDSAIINRPGRFDTSYEVGNPDEEMRYTFYKGFEMDDLLKVYKYSTDVEDGEKNDILNLFVAESDGLSMAQLKELMSTVLFKIADTPVDKVYVKEIVKECATTIRGKIQEHAEKHEEYQSQKSSNPEQGYKFGSLAATIDPRSPRGRRRTRRH